MSTGGVNVSVEFSTGTPFTDEWIDGVYSHLEDAMTVVSVDMAIDEDAHTIDFLLGIEAPDWCSDEEEFSAEVAQAAIKAAIESQDESGEPHAERRFASTSVRAFA